MSQPWSGNFDAALIQRPTPTPQRTYARKCNGRHQYPAALRTRLSELRHKAQSEHRFHPWTHRDGKHQIGATGATLHPTWKEGKRILWKQVYHERDLYARGFG